MAFSHFVPAGKQLYIPTGGYTFAGPRQVDMHGVQKLPLTYTDGTPTNAPPAPTPAPVAPAPVVKPVKPKPAKEKAVPKPEIAKPEAPSE